MPSQPPAWKSTACILCECNCGIEVELGGADGRRFVRVRGDDAHPASQGYACEKPARLDFYQNGPHRLTKPLRRRADGTFEEIDWDTAIREVAARFAAVRDAHGGESIFYYGGGGQGNHLPGAYGARRRARRSAPCTGARSRPGEDRRVLGRAEDGRRLHARRLRALRGRALPRQEPVVLAQHPARARHAEGDRDRPGARADRVDPRRTETADLADIHLQVQPGGDAFLLAAMIAVIVQEGLVAAAWLAEHTRGAEHVLPRFDIARRRRPLREERRARSARARRGAAYRGGRRASPCSRTSACR